MTVNRAAAEAIAANLQRYIDTIDTYVEAVRIAGAQEPAGPEPETTLAQLQSELASERRAHERRSGLTQGLAKWAAEQRDRADAAEARLEQASRCTHGATAEELCNRLPSDAELAEMRASQQELAEATRLAALRLTNLDRQRARADDAEAQLQAVWEQIGYPDPDRRPYNQTLAGAVASAIGYVEARLARVSGPAVAEVLTTPRPNIEEIVQAIVQLAHGPMTPLDGDERAPVDAAVSPEVSPALAPAGDVETPADDRPVSSTGHRWPCTRFYMTSSERDRCTCTPEALEPDQAPPVLRTAQEAADAPDSED